MLLAAPDEPRATSASGSSDRRPTWSRRAPRRCEPLETAANAAWWDANVDARDETAAPPRRGRRRAVRRARRPGRLRRRPRRARPRPRARPAGRAPARACSSRRFTPNQVDADLRREIVELQSDIESRFARHRGDDRRRRRSTTTRSSTSCARATTRERRAAAWEASKSVGAEVADRRARARPAPQPRRRDRSGYRDHFALTLATTDFDEDRLFATLAEVDEITADAVPHAEGRARRAARGALRSRGRRRCARGTTTIRSSRTRRARSASTSIRTSRDADLEALTVRTFEAMGLDVRGVVARSDLDAAAGQGAARVLHRRRPRRRRPRAQQQRARRALGRDDAARVRPRRVLRRRRARPARGCCARCTSASPRASRCAAAGSCTTRSGCGGSPAFPARPSPSSPRGSAPRAGAHLLDLRPLGARDDALRARPVRASRRRSRRPLVGSRRAVPTRAPARRPPRARLGREDPHRRRARLLPQLPVRRADRVAARARRSAGSSTTRRRGPRARRRACFAPGATQRWDHLIEQATGAPLTPAVFARELAS